MKKAVALLFFVLLSCSLYAEFSLGVDAASAESFFLDGLRIDIEVGYLFEREGIRLGVPIRYGESYKADFKYLEAALEFSFFPIPEEGLLIGCSLIQAGYMFGLDSPLDDNFVLSGEGFIGWRFDFPYSFVEPRFVFRNTFSTESSKDKILTDNIPQFFQIYISLFFGIRL